MSAFHDNALMGAAGSQGYQISRSVRLRSSASAYFSRTPASATNQTTWTWSGWVKRGALGSAFLFGAYKPPTGGFTLFLFSGDTLQAYQYNDGTGVVWNKVSTQVLRDPSAWYHLVLTYDSTNATAGDRVRLYVNGSRITSFSTSADPSSSLASWVNTTNRHTIGNNTTTLTDTFFDGYITEVNFIDGQALTPSSFGQNDPVTGVWKPKKYAGTYGTNGFYLNFSDNSNNTAATIGKDYSGNGNNWTPNNISVTTGSTYDSMLDTPTPYADGGNGRGNYAVLNPINTLASGATVSGGNLNIVGASASAYGSPATMLLTSGKWYFEVVAGAVASRYPVVGVQTELTAFLSSGFPGGYTANGFGYGSDGNKYVNNGAAAAFGSTFTSGDVIGVAIDVDAGKVWLSKNSTWQASGDPVAGTNAAYTVTAGTALYPCVGTYNGAGTHSVNFGQRPFTYTPPTGFKALNTQNLPDSTIKKGNQYFDATTYTGNGTSQSVVNGGAFQPDLVWTKTRSAASSHRITDAVRGVTQVLYSDLTIAEAAEATGLTSFNSNGYTAGSGSSNQNGTTYVGWQWQAGKGTTSNITVGQYSTSPTNVPSIASTVSVNTTAGFSVVTWTIPSGNGTVGHGLGVAPKFYIVKARNAVSNWSAWMTGFSTDDYIYLNGTAGKANAANAWGGVQPTSTTIGTNGGVLFTAGNTVVAYCWAEVAGYSRFGSYTGNGSADGPFVFTNFRPRFVMVKRTDTTGNWFVWDTARETFNVMGNYLLPNSSAAEPTGEVILDALSNGFKMRSVATGVNGSGGTYIFAAFAENPFKYALAR